MPKRRRRLLAVLVATALAVWGMWQLSLRSGSGSGGGPGGHQGLVEQYLPALRLLQDAFDREHAQRVLQTAPDALDPDPERYATRLQGFVDDYFAQSPFQ